MRLLTVKPGLLKAIIIGAALLCITSVFIFSSQSRSDDEKPYKATTVDECIQEKECVQYAFINYAYNSTTKYPFVTWKNPLKLRFVGPDNGKPRAKEFLDQVVKLMPYFPQSVDVGNEFNALVIFSDDFKKALKEEYYPMISHAYSDELIDRIYQENKGSDCFTIKVPDLDKNEEEISTSVTLVNLSSKILDACIKTQALYLFGAGAPVNFEFSAFDVSHFNEQTPAEITKLDLFVLYLIHHPDFDQTSTLTELPREFEKIYPKALDEFLKKESI